MKQTITYLISILCYFTGIDEVFYRLNRGYKRIITFHNVMPKEYLPDGKKIGITDTIEEFKQKIDLIKKRFSIGLDLMDTSQAMITFDDGYKNEYAVAGQILKDAGDLPAIIFVSGKVLNNKIPSNALTVDLLMHWINLVPNGCYKIESSFFGKLSFDLTANNRHDVWVKNIWPLFCKDSKQKGLRLLKNLDEMYSIQKLLQNCSKEYTELRLNGIDESIIHQMNLNGWQLGWHTMSHYPLTKLSEKEQCEELIPSNSNMLNILLSYPYGEIKSVGMQTINIAKKIGYKYAVSNLPYPTSFTSGLFLPRMTVSSNKYLFHFEMSGAKYFIKTGKLLPKLNQII